MTLPAGAISIQDLRNEYYAGGGPTTLSSYSKFVAKSPGQGISLGEFRGLAAGPIMSSQACFSFVIGIQDHPADVMWNMNTGAIQMENAGLNTGLISGNAVAPAPLSVSQLTSYDAITHDCLFVTGGEIAFSAAYRNPSAANGWWGGSSFTKSAGGVIQAQFQVRITTTRS